jgi:hypothetical protein
MNPHLGSSAAASSGAPPGQAVTVLATGRAGMAYARLGLTEAGRSLGVHLRVLAAYATPALLASYLAATIAEPGPLEQASIVGLTWITAVVGTVVVMVVVSSLARGRQTGLARATVTALTWVPRYFWTNVHTTIVFWVPIGLLLELGAWKAAMVTPSAGMLGPLADGLWWLLIAIVALCLHTRTLLAPFLAVHADLPGTLAALEAWRLSGRNFGLCLATFVFACLPTALPIGAVALTLAVTLPGPVLGMLLAAWPNLVWVGNQMVRPVLIPAVYALYNDLWRGELARRAQDGEPATPRPLCWLLALTRPLPRLARPE